MAANIFILLHRNEGYKYFPFKSVTELYVTDSTLYLKDVKFGGDSVELIFSKSLKGKYFDDKIDGSYNHKDFALLTKTNNLKFRLSDSTHSYTFQDLDSIYPITSIEVKIDHSTYNNEYVNEFLYCNLPGPKIKVGALNIWQTAKGFSPLERQIASQLLKDKTSFNKDSSDFYKTLAIAKFASTLCKNPKGIHAYALSELRPYAQIQEALKCNANMACGNYAAIVGYLFSVAQIPNRLVTFAGPAGNWQYGVHYYNEVYLREKQQWVLVDAANNIAMPFDSVTHQFLNAVTVKKLVQLNSTNGKLTYTFTKDSVQIVAYNSINSQHIYYNQSNANLSFLHGNADVTYSRFRNFIEFYTFNRDSDFYSDINRNDWCKIVLKELMIVLFLLVSLTYILIELKYMKAKLLQ